MNVKHLSFAMMFLIGAAYADNEIYIDQVGSSAVIEVVQDGSGNKVGGSTSDTTKLLLDGNNMDFNVNMSGGSNNLIGSIIGTSTVDIDIDGSSNDLLFDVDKDNSYGAVGGDFVIDITGGNNALDFDFGSLDTANDLDFDFVLDGDFNEADINIDASSLTFDLDTVGDNNSLLYNASGYDNHNFVLTGTGSYWDIEVNQESTLQSDSLEIEYDGSGTSTTDATICITQSDSGLNTNCGN
jgi:hypothetical protein